MRKLSIIVSFFTALVACEKNTTKTENNNVVDYHERCRKLVLEENKPNQNYKFNKDGKEIDQQSITYLGNVITSKKDTLKIVSYINYTGLSEDSKRGGGELYIYDGHNKQIGFYYLGNALAIPSKLENNKSLLFDYNNDLCNQKTKISLQDSIPKKIFIQCTKEGGDLYDFKPANKPAS
ncbi:MAG: hypothetical protein ACN6OJ_18845 [Chryseobacterium sp.]|uniref:hypothetical protein n=1 Tax=Chryseobacterium sp. TaxID=1871047 RepID=UPI003D1454A2